MNYCGKEVRPLKEYQEDFFEYNDIINMGIAVIKTLQKLHSIGYVHCDIKPSNILYEGDKGIKVYRLIDFGLSMSYLDEHGNHVEKQKID